VQPNKLCHPELVSGPIAPLETAVRGDKWGLKQVQGDGLVWRGALLLLLALLATPVLAQDHSGHQMPMPEPIAAPSPVPPPSPQPDHSAMDHDAMEMGQIDTRDLPTGPSEGSGTSRLPAAEGAMHGLHLMPGDDWMVMIHGTASAQYTKATGPRGDDKFYVTSMGMVTAEKETGWGKVQLKSMFSLEPVMDSSGYPNLFATGETSRGEPLVDRQHPHDLFMELAARVDVNLSGSASLFLYGGPVGEPALGPSAFMHRGSASYNPEPPITHHWFDSTHITYGVVTAGISTDRFQLEASAFRGAEPDERRWNIETPKLDSWSVRASLNPSTQWAIQASYGQIKQPEALHPGEDEHRFTASAHYANNAGLSAMLAFSAKDRVPGRTLTAWLGEANWNIDHHNTLFGRIENVANDELFPDDADPFHEVAFRVSKFQLGYARRFLLGPVELALGGSLAAYAKPAALDAAYGNNPMGYTLFARFSLGH
jgi:hypothetical protein